MSPPGSGTIQCQMKIIYHILPVQTSMLTSVILRPLAVVPQSSPHTRKWTSTAPQGNYDSALWLNQFSGVSLSFSKQPLKETQSFSNIPLWVLPLQHNRINYHCYYPNFLSTPMNNDLYIMASLYQRFSAMLEIQLAKSQDSIPVPFNQSLLLYLLSHEFLILLIIKNNWQ